MKDYHIFLISLFFVFILSVPASASYEFDHLWGSEDNDYIVTVPAGTDENGNVINYPVVARPVGMLSDGSSLNDLIDRGMREFSDQWLEAIYLSTGDVGKGVVDINPTDGSANLPSLGGLPPGHYSRISSAIPPGMGPVYSSVVIHELRYDDQGAVGRASNIYVTTATGNIIAIRADQSRFVASDSSTELFPIEYSLLWTHHTEGSISQSASIYYGDQFTNSDDMIIVSTDSGSVYCFYPNGTVAWNSNLEGSGFYSPQPVDSANMTLILSKNGNMYALDVSDGSLIWHSELDSEIRSFSISHRVDEDCGFAPLFFVGTDRGEIQGIQILDGQLGPKISLKHSVPVSALFGTASSYTIFGGTEEYRDGVGYVFSISKEGDSLKIEWDRDIYGGVSAPPAYFDNRYVYFSSSAGILYGFEVLSGEPVLVLHSVSSALNTVIVATQIPGSIIYRAIIGAHKNGDMFSVSGDATYVDDGQDSDDFPDETSGIIAFPGFIPTMATVVISTILFGRFRKK